MKTYYNRKILICKLLIRLRMNKNIRIISKIFNKNKILINVIILNWREIFQTIWIKIIFKVIKILSIEKPRSIS